jgi:hypothetical protein
MDRRRALVSRSPPGMPDPANPGSASWRWLQTVGSWRKIGARLASLTVRPAGQPGLERRAERSLRSAFALTRQGRLPELPESSSPGGTLATAARYRTWASKEAHAVLACLAGLAGRRPKAAAAALAEHVHRHGLERASETLIRWAG